MKKILIFIITYKASYRVERVVNKIPLNFLKKNFNYKIFISDDCSNDDTSKYIRKIKNKLKSKVVTNINKKNVGYGSNIKICLKYAIKNKYDFAIMIHGDDQYDARKVKQLVNMQKKENSDVVVGSRMKNKKNARKGGMPFYKYCGNIVLTGLINYLFKQNFTDAHSGYWLYNLKVFDKIKLKSITNSFNFDNNLRLELILNKFKISEISIMTKYSDENSYFHLSYSLKFIYENFLFFIKKIKRS